MSKGYLTETEMFQALRDLVAEAGSLAKAGELLFFDASYICNTVNERQARFPDSIAKAMGYQPAERYTKDGNFVLVDEVVDALKLFIVDCETQIGAARKLHYGRNYIFAIITHKKKMTIPFARALGFDAERVFVKKDRPT